MLGQRHVLTERAMTGRVHGVFLEDRQVRCAIKGVAFEVRQDASLSTPAGIVKGGLPVPESDIDMGDAARPGRNRARQAEAAEGVDA